jgi:hypothetical protein
LLFIDLSHNVNLVVLGAGAAGRYLGGGRGCPLRQWSGVGPVGLAGQVELAPLPHPLPPLDLWYAPRPPFYLFIYLPLIFNFIIKFIINSFIFIFIL